jgi:hypothetical protein
MKLISTVALSGGIMPDFEIISLNEAQLRTIPGRQGKFLNEYASFIQQLQPGQAGRLHVSEQENPLTIRRRLVVAAKALAMPLIIKRTGRDIYFWSEDRGEEQPRRKRSYTRRNRRGRAGDYFPPQPFIEPELGEQGAPKEESPELGHLTAEAERRVAQS